MKIETFLPVFPGFYNTIFEPDIDGELYSQNQEREDFLPELEYNDVEFKNKEYEEKVLQECCSLLETELSEFVTKINFQTIVSPKEYNFRNDSGNIEIELSEENINNIREYIYTHKEDYKNYLRRSYTSYDGFMSWYDNDFEGWKEYTDDFTDYSKDAHHLGSVLDFICKNKCIDSEYLYYTIDVNVSEFCEIITKN